MRTTNRTMTVVDTNVAVVANGSDTANAACVSSCATALAKLTKSGCVAIDSGWRIIKEYQQNLTTSGQRGPGDLFLKWLLLNRENTERCEQVHITLTDDEFENYSEFPEDLELGAFDPTDRKFIAVAMAAVKTTVVLEAVDTEWWGCRQALSNSGITVKYVCPDEIERLYLRRHGA